MAKRGGRDITPAFGAILRTWRPGVLGYRRQDHAKAAWSVDRPATIASARLTAPR